MTVVVSDQERVRRVVEDGSRRKRDLSVYRRVKAEENRRRLTELSASEQIAAEAWAATAQALESAVPASTFRIWIEPLRAAGAEGDTLLLAASEGIRAWAERRYASLIGEALQHVSGFKRVSFVAAGESA